LFYYIGRSHQFILLRLNLNLADDHSMEYSKFHSIDLKVFIFNDLLIDIINILQISYILR